MDAWHFRAKTTKLNARNYKLAYLLDFIVMQMSRVYREKGYCCTNCYYNLNPRGIFENMILLRRFRFLFVSFLIPYVNVFLSHSACFSLLASHLHFVPSIFVLVFHVHLVLVYRPCSRFPEPDFQHAFGTAVYFIVYLYLPFSFCSLQFVIL